MSRIKVVIAGCSGRMGKALLEGVLQSDDLALHAARAALANARIKASAIDLIVLATSTPDQTFPATAVSVQAGLGITHGAAFDLQAVCSGFIFALAVVDGLLRSGAHKRALVIGAETFSRILDWSDRSTLVLFGDGAGAVVLEHVDQGGFLGFELGADGSGGPDLLQPGSDGSTACWPHCGSRPGSCAACSPSSRRSSSAPASPA